jgi:hypothetical protein
MCQQCDTQPPAEGPHTARGCRLDLGGEADGPNGGMPRRVTPSGWWWWMAAPTGALAGDRVLSGTSPRGGRTCWEAGDRAYRSRGVKAQAYTTRATARVALSMVLIHRRRHYSGACFISVNDHLTSLGHFSSK